MPSPAGRALLLKAALAALAGGAAFGLAALALPAGGRDLAKLLAPMPDWLEPADDKELPALARLDLGLAMGKSLQVRGLLKARRGGDEYFLADVAEAGRRGEKLYTVAFASADWPQFPAFRLHPRERGGKLPVNLVEVPGAPNFSAAYFLTSPAPAQAQLFFLGGPAAWLSPRGGWRVWCDGRLAVLSRGGGPVPADGLEEFAQDAGELLDNVFRLGYNGFSGFRPGEKALALRSRGV